MADESGERTEPPTQRRRQEAADDGQVPRSQELPIAVTLIGAAMILRGMGGGLAREIARVMTGAFASAGTATLTADTATALFRSVAAGAGVAILGVVAALTAGAVVVQAIQARGTLTTKPLAPKWDRLDPMKNAARLVSMQVVVDLVKSLGKLALVGYAVYHALRLALPDTAALAQAGPLGLAGFLRDYVSKLLMTAGVAYLALAGLDYGWQWWQHEKRLRMTKEEVKRENRESEGDPMMTARRRQIARDRAMENMLRDVPQASVVITNPTHLAIALRYDPDEYPVPVVVAKGRDHLALRIREIAREAGVPAIENKPVARALYRTADVGTMIPYELFVAVAEIIGYVMRTRETRKGWTGSAIG